MVSIPFGGRVRSHFHLTHQLTERGGLSSCKAELIVWFETGVAYRDSQVHVLFDYDVGYSNLVWLARPSNRGDVGMMWYCSIDLHTILGTMSWQNNEYSTVSVIS